MLQYQHQVKSFSFFSYKRTKRQNVQLMLCCDKSACPVVMSGALSWLGVAISYTVLQWAHLWSHSHAKLHCWYIVDSVSLTLQSACTSMAARWRCTASRGSTSAEAPSVTATLPTTHLTRSVSRQIWLPSDHSGNRNHNVYVFISYNTRNVDSGILYFWLVPTFK